MCLSLVLHFPFSVSLDVVENCGNSVIFQVQAALNSREKMRPHFLRETVFSFSGETLEQQRNYHNLQNAPGGQYQQPSPGSAPAGGPQPYGAPPGKQVTNDPALFSQDSCRLVVKGMPASQCSPMETGASSNHNWLLVRIPPNTVSKKK